MFCVKHFDIFYNYIKMFFFYFLYKLLTLQCVSSFCFKSATEEAKRQILSLLYYLHFVKKNIYLWNKSKCNTCSNWFLNPVNFQKVTTTAGASRRCSASTRAPPSTHKRTRTCPSWRTSGSWDTRWERGRSGTRNGCGSTPKLSPLILTRFAIECFIWSLMMLTVFES